VGKPFPVVVAQEYKPGIRRKTERLFLKTEIFPIHFDLLPERGKGWNGSLYIFSTDSLDAQLSQFGLLMKFSAKIFDPAAIHSQVDSAGAAKYS
jgi:hypothetical protein